MAATGTPVALVVPAHRGGGNLAECLQGIRRQTRPPEELLVVADGPAAGRDPALVEQVRRAGARLVVTDAHGGPASARNTGAARSRSPILFFVDSDVVLRPDACARVRDTLEDPGLAGVFGSYDDRPRSPGLTSQYKNLVHHLTHQRASADATTFWAGCGAVRREALACVGGFDESYRRPCVEDIELGYRLRRHGYRVRADPVLQATHLKRWTVGGLARTDLLDRALPWSELILRTGVVVDDLGTQRAARLQLVLLSTAVGSLARWPARSSPARATGLLALVVALDAPLLRGLARLRGYAFALRCVPWRVVHHLVSLGGLTLAAAKVATTRAVRRPSPGARLREPAELSGATVAHRDEDARSAS